MGFLSQLPVCPLRSPKHIALAALLRLSSPSRLACLSRGRAGKSKRTICRSALHTEQEAACAMGKARHVHELLGGPVPKSSQSPALQPPPKSLTLASLGCACWGATCARFSFFALRAATAALVLCHAATRARKDRGLSPQPTASGGKRDSQNVYQRHARLTSRMRKIEGPAVALRPHWISPGTSVATWRSSPSARSGAIEPPLAAASWHAWLHWATPGR